MNTGGFTGVRVQKNYFLCSSWSLAKRSLFLADVLVCSPDLNNTLFMHFSLTKRVIFPLILFLKPKGEDRRSNFLCDSVYLS